ncbi:cytochrome c3 family protein [Geobacter sp.]|uniref:cytochrome c3 family protein n=1 Tax=Geobacter sp. TaxID=46610 RepID=UPI00261E1962|nr:cytochrome c3 family protein [Geobacter sp.]
MKYRFATLITLVLMFAALPAMAKETKDISFKLKNAEPVIFSHDFHLAKYNNNCRICHNALFNLRSRKHYTMAEMEKGKSCGACHTGYKAFSVADEAECGRCHKGKPRPVVYRTKGAGEAVFRHEIHLTKLGNKCRTCHNNKAITGAGHVTMAQMEKGKSCGVCHDGKKAFTVTGSCGKCHQGMTPPKTISFKPKGVAEALFSHDIHLSMFKCADCHTKLFQYRAGARHFTMADMAKGKSCGACHNGKEAFASTGDCSKCHPNLKPGIITWKTSMGEAAFSHEFHLGMFKCVDCHTRIFKYKKGSTPATMAEMETGKSCGACHNGKDAFSVKDDCVKCHKM